MVQHRLQLDRRLAQHARPGRRRPGRRRRGGRRGLAVATWPSRPGRQDRAVATGPSSTDRPTDRPSIRPSVCWGPSRVCAWASVMIRQRLLQPRSSRTSNVRWRPPAPQPDAGAPQLDTGVRSISAPWIAPTPHSLAAWASSIEPESELWSVSASAAWPSSPALSTSSPGSDTPSRNEYAEWQWSST